MRLEHLSLTNYRSISHLDIDIPGGIVLINGRNAQGKTSLLEAIYYTATFTSFLTAQDIQLLSFNALAEEIPVTRIVADLLKGDKRYRLEIRLILQKDPQNSSTGRVRKEILVDGVKKTAAQAIGLFTAVVFIPQMTRMLENGPEERRRYMNLMLCQVVPGYAHHLSKYAAAHTRRNALLKQLGEHGGDLSQLDYWDEQLSDHGAHIFCARKDALLHLQHYVEEIHLGLTAGNERLLLEYRPSTGGQINPIMAEDHSVDELKQVLQNAFLHRHTQDIQRGMTSLGPHRDDMIININDRNLADYGSRGQVRTSLQSLKLAEVEWMHAQTGTAPVLLLDETLAELDGPRRHDLLTKLTSVDQALLTTTDLDLFDNDFVLNACLWEVSQGEVAKVVVS